MIDHPSMSQLLAHLVTFCEASVTRSTEDHRGRYVTVLITTPCSDFAWLIKAPCTESWQRFVLVAHCERDGDFEPCGPELACVTRQEVEFLMRHPYGVHTGLQVTAK